MADIEKLNLKSKNITDEQKAKLKELFPEVLTEGKVDFEKLRLTLGDEIDEGEERFGMTWPGKRDCFKVIQEPSIGTLKPCREESIDFDTTDNLFIEGDNLEVLKLLQKSYYGKIKMIYIDPPYNTGNEFIYPDKYSESLETYLAYTGQVDDEGRKFSTNTEADGRFHSKWLNMMYPRLFLARNLLRDDGVIFINIDDNEVVNLWKICDEVFGEENLLSGLIWHLSSGPQAGHFTRSNEVIVTFAKNKEQLPYFSDTTGGSIIHGALKKISQANPASEITFKAGSIKYEGVDAGFEGELGGSEKQYIVDGKLKFENGILVEDVTLKAGWAMKNQVLSWLDGKETFDSKGQKILRFFFNSQGILFYEKERGTFHPKTVLSSADVGGTKTGSDEIINIFGAKIMDFPKPSSLIRFLLTTVTSNSDIILDFFAGSCPAAHAVLDLNNKDGGNRKFIMVQLPEPCAPDSEAFKAGYKTIADIGKERIRRVIKKITGDQEGKLDLDGTAGKQDLGFKVFKLQSSNFKLWNADVDKDKDAIEKQISIFVDHVKHDRSQEDILYELLLKSGFPLATKIEKITLADKTVCSIDEGAMLVCLEKELTEDLIKTMAKEGPSRVICLDEGFHGNDQLKTNAVQIMKSKNVLNFRTV